MKKSNSNGKEYLNNSFKTACVLRIGGIGDLIMATPIFPLLKKEGYETTVITRPYLWAVLRNNPYVDKIINWRHGNINGEKLTEVFSMYEKQYDKFINLSGSIEGNLLAIEGSKEFYMSQRDLHKRCNKNYYEETMSWAGYKDYKGDYKPELYLSSQEEKHGENYKSTLDSKVILWSMTGSSIHKAWPRTEETIIELLEEHKDLKIITVGEGLSHLIEPKHKRAINRAGIWTLRRSILMAKYADLIVTPDTGMCHIAAAFEKAQIILLSGITKENLSKHWNNAITIEPHASCYPCHKMLTTRDHCEIDVWTGAPACIESIQKETIKEKVEEVLYG